MVITTAVYLLTEQLVLLLMRMCLCCLLIHRQEVQGQHNLNNTRKKPFLLKNAGVMLAINEESCCFHDIGNMSYSVYN